MFLCDDNTPVKNEKPRKHAYLVGLSEANLTFNLRIFTTRVPLFRQSIPSLILKMSGIRHVKIFGCNITLKTGLHSKETSA